MGLSVGIVGLPNVGKSTLFNALLKQEKAEVSNYPFCTIKPNIGLVEVPDKRLDILAQKLNLPQKIPAILEIVDIAGLVKGAHKGEGLGNEFLSHIQSVDLILHVIRFFEDPKIAGVVDPESDLETIKTELALKDLQIIERREEKLEKEIKAGKKEALKEKEALLKVKENLENPKKLLDVLSQEEREFLAPLSLLSLKPVLYIANISENQLKTGSWKRLVKEERDFIPICAQLEVELAQFSEAERNEYLKEIGVFESATKTIIQKCYQALNLITFYTLKPKEQIQAWSVKKETPIVKAAGKIHSDFEEKFISAEVISWQELLEEKDFKTAKEKGKVRVEGKNYLVQDGDIVYILHR